MERWRGALSLLGDDAEQLRWLYGAFELDPDVPPEGTDAGTYVKGRYDPAMVEAMRERLSVAAREEGLPLMEASAMTIRPNTFAAHRLLTAAADDGVGKQHALADALFRAYWVRAEDIGDHQVLAGLARGAGLAESRVSEILAGDDYGAEVRVQEQRAAALGIHAVPTFVFADQFAFSGAHPSAALAEAARRALRDA